MKKFQEYLNEFNLNIPLASEVAPNQQSLQQDYAHLYKFARWAQIEMPTIYPNLYQRCQELLQKIEAFKQPQVGQPQAAVQQMAQPQQLIQQQPQQSL